MTKHKARIKTGFLLGLLAIGSVFYFPNALFALMCGMIVTLAFWEWLFLVQIKSFFWRCLFLLVFWLLALVGRHHLQQVLTAAVYFWLCTLILIFLPKTGLGLLKNRFAAVGIGFLALAPAWIAVVELHAENRLILFYLVMLISFADTAAYFVGSKWGKHKLLPKISPKKSFEGLMGGLLVGSLAGLLEVLFMPDLSIHKILTWTMLGLFMIMVSVLGDLFESLMKRLYDVKDSGSFLPGHGGFLDRIDSHASAMPIFLYVCMHLHLLY